MREFISIFTGVITEQVMKPVTWCIENTDTAGAWTLAICVVAIAVTAYELRRK